jgi:monoterpene epsilon-lactone hydrolase
VASPEAQKLNDMLRNAPKQVEMDLPHQRQAGEHAEDLTTEPEGVIYEDAPTVNGLWAKPQKARRDAVVLYLFGGGYVISSPHSRRKFAGHLATASGTLALIPGYRLAPEHPFPAAVEDATAAYKGLLEKGFEPERVIIAGDSSGGGLTMATLLALREKGLPLPVGSVPISPWVDLACTGETLDTRADVDLTVTKSSLQRMAKQYLNGSDPRNPLGSPLYANLSGLPPLLVIVGGDEALLDDSVRLVRKAGIAGVDVTLYIGAKMQHVFPLYVGFMPEAAQALVLIGAWVRSRIS